MIVPSYAATTNCHNLLGNEVLVYPRFNKYQKESGILHGPCDGGGAVGARGNPPPLPDNIKSFGTRFFPPALDEVSPRNFTPPPKPDGMPAAKFWRSSSLAIVSKD